MTQRHRTTFDNGAARRMVKERQRMASERRAAATRWCAVVGVAFGVSDKMAWRHPSPILPVAIERATGVGAYR